MGVSFREEDREPWIQLILLHKFLAPYKTAQKCIPVLNSQDTCIPPLQWRLTKVNQG